MREILFRGKRTDNGEWFYGYYTNARYYLDKKEMHIIFEQDVEVYPHSEFAGGEEVIPETVGQYTGLTDKNGRKIFEGDILGGFLDEEYPEHETVVVVEWHENMWVTRQGEYLPDLLELDDSDCFEVIGNIYDNPELLEGGGNG